MAFRETKVAKFTFAILAVIVCFAVSAEDDLLDQVLFAPPSSPAVAGKPFVEVHGAPKDDSAAQIDDAIRLDEINKELQALRKEIAEIRKAELGTKGTETVGKTRTSPLTLKSLSATMIPIPGKSYAMCKYEVTQTLWQSVMGNNPSRFRGGSLPVEQVSWDDCQMFLERLNSLPDIKAAGCIYRLPTAEEWEFACKAGAEGDFCLLANGMQILEQTLDEVAWYRNNSGNGTHAVGEKKANAFGLHDMHGNVAEFVAVLNTKHLDYSPVGYHGGSFAERGSYAVCCGGGCQDNASGCKALSRRNKRRDYRDDTCGFRLACDIVK